MPISSQHPEYGNWIHEWIKCRDAFEGQSAIKRKGVKYLPRLSGQTDEEYNAYKERALFYSITSKSIGAMVGMAMSKPPVINAPADFDYYFTENSGIQFYEALSNSLGEDLLMGRYGVLIDRPRGGGRPMLRGYFTEDIINWKVDDEGRPTLVVLKEKVFKDNVSDKYTHDEVIQYRELEMVNGVYVQTIKDEQGLEIETITPVNTGKTMDFIPFFIVNPFGVGFGTTKPPVLDIVEINISHYRTSADLEHGRHFTGLPTPVVSGVASDTILKIGSMTAWILPDVQADAKYLEFTGQGLLSLEKALQEKQSQLASLSARLLDNSKNGSEAAETVKLRYMSETASLASVVRAVEAFLNLCFKCIAIMEDVDPKTVSIILDKEFLNTRLSPTDILKLTDSFLKGGMSAETYVFNLRRGDAIAADRSDEDEIKAATEARNAVLEAEKAAAAKAVSGGPTT